MLTSRVFLAPSSPTLLIDERRGDSSDMIAALLAQGERLEAEAPDAIVVVTSRWEGRGLFHADDTRTHRSVIDLPGFGVEPRYDCSGDPALARALVAAAAAAGLRAAPGRRGADTGVSVPLHFLAPGRRGPVVPVSISDGPAHAHRRWGQALRQAIDAWTGRIQFVVSGLLTFSPHEFNLRRESLEDRDLDTLAIGAMRAGDWDAIGERAARFPAKAHPDAGWRHLHVLRGFLGEDRAGELIAYEPLPGIGSVLMAFDVAAAPAADEDPGPAAD